MFFRQLTNPSRQRRAASPGKRPILALNLKLLHAPERNASGRKNLIFPVFRPTSAIPGMWNSVSRGPAEAFHDDQHSVVPCQDFVFGWVIAKRLPLSDVTSRPPRIFRVDKAVVPCHSFRERVTASGNVSQLLGMCHSFWEWKAELNSGCSNSNPNS